jgi:hypothetical protein
MDGAVMHRCHVAVISPCDDTASEVCHRIGRDYGDESFSGFEFRHRLDVHCDLRCHLLYERCSENDNEWPESVNRIAKLVSHFFDLDCSACPLIVLSTSLRNPNERLLSQHLIPMICKYFPGVPVIAVQSEAFSSKPLDCLQAIPLAQCLSYSDKCIPEAIVPVLANLFYSCSCSRQKGTHLTTDPQFFDGPSFNSSPVRVTSFSIPVSPAAPDHSRLAHMVAEHRHLSSTESSVLSSTSVYLDEAPPFSEPLVVSPGTTSNAMLGLSLKWNADGLIVQGVAEDSVAGKSGNFKVGDMILHVDGIDVAYSRVSRHEAIARLRQACDSPVQVCTRAGPGWQGDPSRPFGSTTLFQLMSSSESRQISTSSMQSTLQKTGSGAIDDANADFAQARHFHLTGNSVAAAAHLLKAARRNHPPSCAMLASFYMNGCGGLPQNYQLAFALARWSSLQKDPDGMGILASCYLFGLGTNQDFALAHTLAVGCSEASPHGQFCLGYMYLHGLGVAKDSSAAQR